MYSTKRWIDRTSIQWSKWFRIKKKNKIDENKERQRVDIDTEMLVKPMCLLNEFSNLDC